MMRFALLLVPTLALADATPASTVQEKPVVEKPPEVSPLKATPDVSLSPLRLLPSDLDRIEHRARVRRNTGMGLAVPGVALVVLGAVLTGTGRYYGALAAGDNEIVAGTIMMGAGVLFAIPGTYLWIDGQSSLDTAAWRRSRAVP